MKNIPAAQEDAKEEEQKIPKAGDVLTEQDAFFFKNCRKTLFSLRIAGISSKNWQDIYWKSASKKTKSFRKVPGISSGRTK